MSKPTAKRTLIYFLIHIRAISAEVGARYMVDAELKSMSLYDLMTEIEEEIKR